jgi:hypothetical protein
MAEAFIKYEVFKDELMKGNHGNFSTPPALKVALSNTAGDVAPALATPTLSDITQPTGTGYTAGGASATAAYAYSGGTVTISGTAITWTAGAGGITAFQHAILYNDTHASKGLIGAWTRAAGAVTLAEGETFTLKFNSLTGSQPMFTVA